MRPDPELRATKQNAQRGIAMIVVAMSCITANDMLIKQLSDSYPLHQMVFVRSAIGMGFSFVILHYEGGLSLLRTNRIGLHFARGLCIVAANMLFFAALAVIPLADATALFFAAPLFITLLSIPFLGEQVGPRRIAAVLIGFIGVLVMLRPVGMITGDAPDRIILLLPVLAAFAYACMQILTRRLSVTSKPSAMAIYIQTMFIMVSLGFWAVAGDGRFADGAENKSLIFLLRAWSWPDAEHWPMFAALGFMSAIVAYTLSRAYSEADAATIAPFEYVALPMSIFWGWAVFGHLPDIWVGIGILLIAASGIYVFARERLKARPLAASKPVRRY